MQCITHKKGFISSFIIAISGWHTNVCILFEQRIKSETWTLIKRNTEYDVKDPKCTTHTLLFHHTVMHADVTHLVLGFFFFFVSLDIRFTSSQINNELQCNFRTKKNMPNGMSANDFACCMNNNNGRRPYFHGSLLYITLLYSKHKKCMRTENSINIPKQLLIAWHSRLRFQFQFYGLVGKLETHEICTCLMLAHWYGKIFFFFYYDRKNNRFIAMNNNTTVTIKISHFHYIDSKRST